MAYHSLSIQRLAMTLRTAVRANSSFSSDILITGNYGSTINTNNITYVLKKYNNGTYIMNIYQLVSGCYRLVARQNGNCVG